ncbi:MAG: retropepsin-like aspartic protease [Gammaproteobacteria bacterium]|nr:retropepsin-like aspartic protease [Gammaproteobacteria bacterium]
MRQKQVTVHSFTNRYNGISKVLTSECGVHSALEGITPDSLVATATGGDAPLEIRRYTAIWDTGATNTSITQKVASECGLIPVGTSVVHHANGSGTVDVYLASIFLPNGVVVPEINVNQAVLKGADVLIGMDIMGLGDFAVSNYKGSTQFSFRMPSMLHFDFTETQKGRKPGRKNPRRR